MIKELERKYNLLACKLGGCEFGKKAITENRDRLRVKNEDLQSEINVLRRTANAQWISVKESLPAENEIVDVWLGRGRRCADCYWVLHTQGGYSMPFWYYRNGFDVWKQFQEQDVTHWRELPLMP